jgi:hypothetical protein
MADAAPPPERRSLIREPLLHFAVLGVLIFVGQRLLRDEPDEDARAPIVITDHLRETLAADRHRRVGERPEGEDLDALVASYVRDEALYREALRLGLDRGDTIVRRRLVQKMEFVLQGAAEVPEPSDEELRAFVEDHAEEFRAPARVAYEQVFLSRDSRGESLAEDATAVMEALAADPESGESLGDPFITGRTVALSTEAQIAGRMGVEFAAAVTAAPEGEWVGPIESSYGLHAVRVTERETARMRDLEEVREAALRGWLEEARATAAQEAIEDIVAEYPVEGAER